MNITVYQQIHIHLLKVGTISNSSILQIGSSGSIQALSNLYNTGGFTKPAEQAQPTETLGGISSIIPIVPPS
jgi:spore germination protein PB